MRSTVEMQKTCHLSATDRTIHDVHAAAGDTTG